MIKIHVRQYVLSYTFNQISAAIDNTEYPHGPAYWPRASVSLIQIRWYRNFL